MGKRLGVVLLAAGRSERFGENKLLADFAGRPMVCYALEAAAELEAACRLAVCSCEAVAAIAQTHGFSVVQNDAPEAGQAHSIVLGVQEAAELDAVLLLAGDMPLLTGESLRRLVQGFERSRRGMACLADETHRGNPAVFDRRYFPELLALSGDRGAKGILRAHEDDLMVVPCVRKNELADADTPQALEALGKRI